MTIKKEKNKVLTFKTEGPHETELFKNFAGAKGMNLSNYVRSLIFKDIATTPQSELDAVKKLLEV